MSRKPVRKNKMRNNRFITSESQPKTVVRLGFPRHVFSLTLLAMLVFGMISFTFAYIVDNSLPEVEEGSTMMSVRTAKAVRDNEDIGAFVTDPEDKQSDKTEAFLTKLGSNVDLAETGATSTTVYYAVDTTYTVKCNVNRKGDGDDWKQYTMSLDGTNTFGGKPVYKVTFTDLYNGLGALQFQLYDGDTWKSQVQPISSWTSVGTYNGKIYDGDSWETYTPDPVLTKLGTPSLKYNNATTTPVDLYGASSASLTWANVSNASSYTVYKDGTAVKTNATSPYSVTSTGSYTVKAIGNGTTYSDSDASNAIQVNFHEFYLLGLENEGTWTPTDSGNKANKMTYNSTTGLYEFTINLYQGSATYQDEAGFKVYDPVGNTYYGADYRFNGMSYNHTTLSTTGANLKLTTKDLSSVTSNAVPYKFTYDKSSKILTVYYPMKVTYNMQSHGTNPSANGYVVAYGSKITAPTAPTATGYTFGGWYKEAAFTNAWNFNTDTVTDDTVLYAKWTAKTSALTFNLNGGSGTAPTGKTATYGSAMPTYGESAPTKTGYSFDGFYDAQTGGTKYYTSTLTSARNWNKNITSGTTLYAHWTAKTTNVSFNQNTTDTVTGMYTGTIKETYGSQVAAYTSNVPVRRGYTFKGFFDAATGATSTRYYMPSGTSVVPDTQAHPTWDKEDTTFTLYARWDINHYNVNFSGKLRNGSNEYNDFTTIPAGTLKVNNLAPPQSLAYGTSVTLTAGNITGYTFNGIYSGSTKATADSSYSFTLSDSDVNYCAYYTKNLEVTFTYSATATDANNRPTSTATLSFTPTTTGGDGSTKTYTYQYSTDRNTWYTITDPTQWKPPASGTYYVKVTASDSTVTGTAPYQIQEIEIVKDQTTYQLTTSKGTGGLDATVTFNVLDEGTTYTDANSAVAGSTVSVKLKRPTGNGHTASDYYFSSVTVTMGSTTLRTWSNVNGDIAMTQVTNNVTDNISVVYIMKLKPRITINDVSHVDTHTLVYTKDTVSSTVSSAGSYYVDYGSSITYTATPASGYFINNITATGVLGTPTTAADKTTSTIVVNSVTTNGTLAAEIIGNRTVTVKLASGSSGGSLKIGGNDAGFKTPVGLGYNIPTNVVITPPEGKYVSSVTKTSGSASYTNPTIDKGPCTIRNLQLTTSNVVFTVTYSDNPVIHLVQPQYGSIYITSVDPSDNTKTRYHMDGDSVEYNTQLTIHVHSDAPSTEIYGSDHPFFTVNSLTYNDGNNHSVTNTDGTSPVDFNISIKADTTYSADITYHLESMNLPDVMSGFRRIILTDNKKWSGEDGQTDGVYVHFANTESSYAIGTSPNNLTNNVRMQFMYLEGINNSPVLYADIPQASTKVFFYKGGSDYLDSETCIPNTHTNYGTVSHTQNAFSVTTDSGSTDLSNTWTCRYADFRSVDSAGSSGDKQQAITSINKAVTFNYEHDYADDLAIETIAGAECRATFRNGTMRITPTSNLYNYSLVKVYSKSSGNYKYYLIRIKDFALYKSESPQKVYNPTNLNSFLINTWYKAVSPVFTYEYSKNNFDGFTNIVPSTSQSGDPAEIGSLSYALKKAYFNYTAALYGITYFKTTVTDGSESDSQTVKTIFDLSNVSADGVIYFNNTTMVSVKDYDVLAVFTIPQGESSTKQFVSMRQVSNNSEKYRVPVPAGATSVAFYLMYQDNSPRDYTHLNDIRTSDNSSIYYYAKTSDMPINSENRLFDVSYVSGSLIEGEFTTY